MKIKVRYYNLSAEVTKKIEENIELKEGSTVNDAVNFLIEKYGFRFQQRAILTMDSMKGKVTRANVYLNGQPADYEVNYPKKMNTVLKDGDKISFGSIIGGGSFF